MKQLQLSEIKMQPPPSPEEHYNQLWTELSSLQEPARKNTKAWQAYQASKQRLLVELKKVEREMEAVG